MPFVDLLSLRAEMEAEREWREAEMRLFRNQVASLENLEQQRVARKALVVMLYAHFEGLTKTLLTMYVNHINTLAMKVSEVSAAFGAAAIEDVFKALRDGTKKCPEFTRQLPDDTGLHRFAREREFVEVAQRIASRTVAVDPDNIVDTESNLKPVVLRKILFRLGLDPNLAEPWEATINQLLRRRNDIAHGSARSGIDAVAYSELEQAVKLVFDGLICTIADAVSRQSYRAAS